MTGMEDAVESALRMLMADLDYDLHKALECDEETGHDWYPGHAAVFAEALTAAGFGNLHDAWADTISRVEVIDDTGRAYTKYTPAGTVRIDRQDQGRTLKVFITEGATK